MSDSYIYPIAFLLPLSAILLTIQVNPYHALVIRGIFGAVAVLLYTVLGAADVALTEALVGTLLAIALYAVAVRSSMVFRLGVLATELKELEKSQEFSLSTSSPSPFSQVVQDLRRIFGTHHMQVELVPYSDKDELQQALNKKDIHAVCVSTFSANVIYPDGVDAIAPDDPPIYLLTTRLQHLHDILRQELAISVIKLTEPYQPQYQLQHQPQQGERQS